MSNKKEILGQFRSWAGLVPGFTGEEVSGIGMDIGELDLGLNLSARLQLRAAAKSAQGFHWPF